jgi:hypothetical protein
MPHHVKKKLAPLNCADGRLALSEKNREAPSTKIPLQRLLSAIQTESRELNV